MIHPLQPPDPAAVAAHYDDLDVFYRDVWGEHVHHGYWASGREPPGEAAAALVHRVARAAGLAPGDRVCDVGCGYGGTARLLAGHYQADVTGVTISRAQFEYAQRQPVRSGRVRFRLEDWLDNTLPADSYDVVLAIESTEHMPSLARFLSECRRVLKPGGRLVICAWLSREHPSRRQVRHLLEPICREGRLVRLGTRREYADDIEEAGLRLDAYEDITRRVRKTWVICARRLLGRLLGDRRYRRFLFDRAQPNRVFALTLIRLLLAFYSGALRYCIFTAGKK
jgi:tocopherol O-methyltransferase